jgi:predicted nucleic acid-binding protein
VVVFADSSFILSLYLWDAGNGRALKIAQGFHEPFPLTPLLVLEMRNAVNLRVQRGELDSAERNALWRTFEADLAGRAFIPTPIPVSENYRLARELSDRHTPHFGTRSLDLLHLAAAQILGAREFLTFDEKQAKAARAEGLNVRP